MKNKKGFTMVELLVVLIIIAILAAVATPIYLANARRARVSEAIATMSLIRQGLRDWHINHTGYFTIARNNNIGNIQNALPTSVGTASPFTPNPATAGLDIPAEVRQYFSNGAFTVNAATGADWTATAATLVTNLPVDFVIRADGDDSQACTTGAGGITTNCAVHAADVAGFELEMDNSGRIFVCYGTCGTATNWAAY